MVEIVLSDNQAGGRDGKSGWKYAGKDDWDREVTEGSAYSPLRRCPRREDFKDWEYGEARTELLISVSNGSGGKRKKCKRKVLR